LEAEKCFASSSEISKGNEKQWLIYCHLSSFEGSRRQKREWKNPYGDREGDVHDIGKIVAVVLACNNYEIDLG
jgi:methanogenic corrinoid protein MtbC1